MIHRVARRAVLFGALLAVSTSAVVAAPSAVAQPSPTSARNDLAHVVTEHMRARASVRTAGADVVPTVNPVRRSDDWAFGTAVLATPRGGEALPEGWLFVAERTAAGWQVALEGEPEFAKLSSVAPVVTDRERPLLAAQGGDQPGTMSASDGRTGMRLPFTVGQTWYMGGGPHGWGGSEQPWSSIDLSGGDQHVLSARGGTAYTMCQGWIRVIHDRGYATDYYHLWNNINVNGAAVSEGSYLGDTGTDVTCGGAANGRHVHFALRQNNAYLGIADHNFGKWVIRNGGAVYDGAALHGSAVVYVGGGLYNYGALGLTQAVVDANGGGVVNKRSGPGSGYAISGTVGDGATVGIACSAYGTSHTGRWGTTNLWNRLTDGTWISDAFAWTGISGAVNGFC